MLTNHASSVGLGVSILPGVMCGLGRWDVSCFTNFTCCWCAYVCPYHIAPALARQDFQNLEFGHFPRSTPQHIAVNEATDPFKWAPTSISNTYKVFHNLHMLWMCMRICPYHVTSALVRQAVGSYLSRNQFTSWEAHHSMMWWLKLQTHSSELPLPHQYQTHIRCFSTFKCCVCTYVSVLMMLPLLLLTKLLEVNLEFCYLQHPL